MLYDIRVDVIDPESGEVIAERGEIINDPDRIELIDIMVREARKEGFYHYTVSRVGSQYKCIE